VVIWAGLTAVAAVGLSTALSSAGWGVGNPWTLGFLAAVAAIGERGRVPLTKTTAVSVSLIPTLFAAVLFGPLASLVVGAVSFAGDLGRPYIKWVYYTSSRAISGSLAGLAVAAVAPGSHSFGKLALGTAVGAVVAGAGDTSFAVTMGVFKGHRALDVIRVAAPPNIVSMFLYAPVVAGLAYSYRSVSPWTLLLFFAPALAAQRLFGLYQEQRRLTEDLYAVNTRLERANISFSAALVATLDARDRYTAGHSAAVAIYARDIAARLGLSDEQQQLAHLCGLVHDIGKIGLPAGLLEKQGPLTLEERRVMETHSEIGERILAKVEDYAEIARIVRHHHERWDGEGYPDKLRFEEIPLLSRIIAVADAYNAMTSDRPYRDAMPSRVARMRLAQGVESQFDTSVVAAFEAILAAASEPYRTGRRADFILEIQDHLEESDGQPIAHVA
jgi:putative nucleotidyltransferase with HDIG domain